MESKIKVSIVIPMYNSYNTLVRALNSIVNQTYKNYEIVIVDDGSKINSELKIKKFFDDKNVSFKYIYQINTGPSIARNNGVKNSKGKYIAFLDSDDEWHYKKLEIQMGLIKKKNLNFLGSTYQYNKFDDNIDDDVVLKKFTFNELLIKTQFSTPGVIIKKTFFLSLSGFDSKMKYAEDNDLWLRASILNKSLYLITTPKLVRLYKNAYGDSGLSGNMFSMFKGELYLLKKLRQEKSLNSIKYILMCFFITLKFIRRLIKKNATTNLGK